MEGSEAVLLDGTEAEGFGLFLGRRDSGAEGFVFFVFFVFFVLLTLGRTRRIGVQRPSAGSAAKASRCEMMFLSITFCSL